MLIGITLMILIVMSIFSLVLGGEFISGIVNIAIDNEALVDGEVTTFVVEGIDVLFTIDTTVLIVAGIALLGTVIVVAAVTGITFLASGLNPQSSKIIIYLTAFIGIWAVLSILSWDLIREIEVFGSVIYITMTLGYTIGVTQTITGGN